MSLRPQEAVRNKITRKDPVLENEFMKNIQLDKEIL